MKYILFTDGILSARYDDAISGTKTIMVDDPDWERPTIDIDDPDWERPTQIGDDPEWQRPSINIVLQPGESGEQDGAPFTNETDEPIVIGTEPDLEAEAPQVELPDDSIPHPQVQVPDWAAIPDQIEVDNPDCKIPAESIEVDDELFIRTINEQDGVWSLVNSDIVKKPFPSKTVTQLKDNKRAEIKQAFIDASDAAVTLNAIVWDGGFESAIKLDAAMRLSESAGAGGVIFYDSDNVSHALNFDDALDVCIGVAVAYQTALGTKQKLYSDIEKATTVAAVNKIKWPSND